jgi:hypothetical protein
MLSLSFGCRLVSFADAPSRHEFEWKKDECYMIRKPDPPVLVAVTSEPPSRIRNGTVQILDYNLNRYVSLRFFPCCLATQLAPKI